MEVIPGPRSNKEGAGEGSRKKSSEVGCDILNEHDPYRLIEGSCIIGRCGSDEVGTALLEEGYSRENSSGGRCSTLCWGLGSVEVA